MMATGIPDPKDASPSTAALNRAVTGRAADAGSAEGRRRVIEWVFSDLDRRYVVNLENCALTCLADGRSEAPDTTVTLERTVLNGLVLGEFTLADAVQRGLVRVEGDAAGVAELFGLLDDFSLLFEVVEPKREGAAIPRS